MSEFFIPFTSHSINIINLMKLNLLQTVSIYENGRKIYMMKERRAIKKYDSRELESIGQN